MAWKKICSISQIDVGEMRVVELEGTNFLILYGQDSDPLVVPPICPHMNADLCDGVFDGEVLTCTKHLWQWSAKDGRAVGIAEHPLLVYRSRQVDGALEVDFTNELRYGHQGGPEV